MAQNHLVIGLGGTGGKIIRALRKTMYLDQGDVNTSGDQHFRFLYVDTSREMMDLDDPEWRVLGHSVQLEPASQLVIEDAAMHSVLADIDSHPQIKAWIGDANIMGSIPGDVAAGGQKRRVGRFKFARKAGEFMQRVHSLVGELQGETKQNAVKFHVFCGLAGGTGSGSVVDAVAMLRSHYNTVKQHVIVVYTLLPEETPKGNRNTGNYHANGYAALTELNALSVGAWVPHDLRTGERIALPSPNAVPIFDSCYVFTDKNEGGVAVDVDKELPNIVADYVFQRNGVVLWDNLDRAEKSENGSNTPELDSLGDPARGKRFITFGIKRLVVPETEIREYLTYSIAEQAAWQQLYNTWVDDVGFVDQARPKDLHSEVNDANRHNEWMITDHHLTLSEAVLEDDRNRNWKRIEDDWMAVMDRFAGDVKAAKSKVTERIVPLRSDAEKRFSENFRQFGVPGFYDLKGKARGDIARAIRRRIEQDLFNGWSSGQRSLMELDTVAGLLRSHLDTRLQKVPERIERHRNEADQYRGKVEALTKEINSLGLITFGKDEKLWSNLVDALKHQYVHRTYGEAWKFAQSLLQQLLMEVDEMIGQIQKMSGAMKKSVEQFSTEIRNRCQTGPEGKDDYTTKVYDPEQVIQVKKRLIADEVNGKARLQRLRQNLVERMGPAPAFAAFNDKFSIDRLRNLLTEMCDAEALDAHQQFVAQTNRRVLGVNIVERLYEKFQGDPQGLKAFVQSTVQRANAYVTWAETEAQRQGDGIPKETTRQSTFGVILPACDAAQDFRATLAGTFRGAHAGAEIIDVGARPSEITVIHVKNLFPLRFLNQTEFLRTEYNRRRASASPVDKLVMHGEDDGSQFPSLYALSTEEVKLRGLKFIFIAIALEMIKYEAHPTTGKQRLVLNSVDADGFPQQTELGADLLDAYRRIGAKELQDVQTAVETVLREPANQHEDHRRILRERVVGANKQVLELVGGDQQNAMYKTFLVEAKNAVNLLK
ncbi:MAG: tubulin-like doman-containing protein [Sulfuritalea sp.]|nr:tubulin-like doman-containing protein [Sulfuritalea sp.]